MDEYHGIEVMSLPMADKYNHRPLVDYPPGGWGDYFVSFPLSPKPEESSNQRIDELENEVKAMFRNFNNGPTENRAKTLRLIDDLQRLGIAYRFEQEINKSLRLVEDDDEESADDIRIVSVCFSLLRQHGHNISSDIFKKFKDGEGKFKVDLSSDMEGLLYLYEASFLGTHEDEILDEVFDFCKGHMEQYVMAHRGDNDFLATKIKRALETPFFRRFRRLEARHSIEIYRKDKASNPALLELASLDFNLVQRLHQAEVKAISIWDFEDVDQLSGSARVFANFFKIVNDEFEDEMIKSGMLLHHYYVKECFKGYVEGYFVEAIWGRDGYTPTLQEYLHINSGYPLLICITPMLNGEEMPRDILDWVLKVPTIIEASSKIARLMDDLVTTKFEQQRMHVASSVQCYANKHGVTEQEACVKLKKMVASAWKDMNKGLIDPCPFKKQLNMLALDCSRVMELLYKYDDIFSNPSGETKRNIAAVLVHPV